VVAAWNRYQVARIVGAVAAAWVIGATALYFAERGVNSDFATWDESLWSVWVPLFSGLHEPPKTAPGLTVTMAMLVLGVGAAGLFTAGVASLLVERYLRRREVSSFEMKDHLVLCN
jgi:voltage-gated potassium channel